MIKAIAIDDEPLALKVIESLCAKSELVELQKTFTEPNEALRYLRKYPADLIFVDIHMPSMTGLSLVRALEQKTMVIFTTAYSEYAITSYELNAIDYLLKPINNKRFSAAIQKAQEYYNYIQKRDNGAEQYIYVRADFSLVKIAITDILYIEGLADYLKIYIQNRKTIVVRMTMKEMLEKLPSDSFIRVHRSYILPFKEIISVRGNQIALADREIPIGKTYLDGFYEQYGSK